MPNFFHIISKEMSYHSENKRLFANFSMKSFFIFITETLKATRTTYSNPYMYQAAEGKVT